MIDLANVTVREYLRVSQDRSGIGKSPDQQHDEMEREWGVVKDAERSGDAASKH